MPEKLGPEVVVKRIDLSKDVVLPGETVEVGVYVENTAWYPQGKHTTYLYLGKECKMTDLVASWTEWWTLPHESHYYKTRVKMPSEPGTYTFKAITTDELKEGGEGKCAQITVIEPPPVNKAKIVITSEPTGAAIYLNNKFVGYTPLTVEVDPGPYLIRAEKSGYIAVERGITVEAGKTYKVDIKLQPKPGLPDWAKVTLISTPMFLLGFYAPRIVETMREKGLIEKTKAIAKKGVEKAKVLAKRGVEAARKRVIE